MEYNDSVFNEQELPFGNESSDDINTATIPDDYDKADMMDYCSICSDIVDFLKLTDAMVEEINELRAEVVRWRKVLVKYLPPEWSDGLQQDILSGISYNDFEDFDAYKYYINRCYKGEDPLNNEKRSKLMLRLAKGTDKSSIKYL